MLTSDEATLDNVVSAHLQRYQESLGYKVGYLALKAAWPPAAQKHAGLCESDIKNRIQSMEKEGADDITRIAELLREQMKQSVDATLVVPQGVSKAQGTSFFEFTLLKTSTKNAQNVERV